MGGWKAGAAVLLGAGAALAAAGAARSGEMTSPTSKPGQWCMVKAWRKTGRPKSYRTQTLQHLPDFAPPAP